MKITTLLLLIFSTYPIFGQNSTEEIWGGINENCFAGKVTSYCFIEKEIKLFERQLLTVTDYTKCDVGSDDFFEIYFKGSPYFVKSENLTFLDKEKSIEKLKNLDSISKSDLKTKAKKSSVDWYNLEMEKAKKLFEKCKSNGIAIIDYSLFDESEYTNGTGYRISFFNTSKKTIKYVWLTLSGYNPVKDLVATKTVKCVGPIEYDTNGEYTFNYVWNTDLVETVKLANIKIQYMDGTFKTAPAPKQSFLSDWCAFMIYENNPHYSATEE